tara:strand:+ start:88 stop:354 length:267 start_codon:yes stop_codon:yes gene_type:complete
MNSRRPAKKKSDHFFWVGLGFFSAFPDFFSFFWWLSYIISAPPTSTPCNSFADLKAGEGVAGFPFITPGIPERTNQRPGNYKNNLLNL